MIFNKKIVIFTAFCFIFAQTNSPQNVPGLQKLSPTSPRTKQTPRKNTNPIRTTSLSPATQTSSQSAVPHPANASVAIGPSPVKSTVTAPNVTPTKPSIVNVVTATPSKVNISTAPVTQTTTKPVQTTPLNNSNLMTNIKSNVNKTPKTDTVPISVTNATKTLTPDVGKITEVKEENPEKMKTVKADSVKVEKTVETPKKIENTSIKSASALTTTSNNNVAETKSKPNASQIITTNTNQCETKETDKKEKMPAAAAKPLVHQTTKTPIEKLSKVSYASTSASNSNDFRVKRNRFKTIPYQSPTPEIELVSKISATEAINAHKKKIEKGEDKLTLFYK